MHIHDNKDKQDAVIFFILILSINFESWKRSGSFNYEFDRS
jgi:hypothetical protein